MSWLDALLGRIFSRDVEIPLGKGLNFKAPLIGTLNSSTKLVDVIVADASLSPAQVAAEDDGEAVPFVQRFTYTAGTPGTADDVTLISSATYGFRIIDAWTMTVTHVSGSSVRLRSAAGGGGTALSSSMSTNAADNMARNDFGATTTVAAGTPVFLRRTDRGVSGEVCLLVVRT